MLKANPFISTFIHLFVKSAPAHPKPRNVSTFKVIGSFTLKNSKKHKVKNYGWHLLVMVITHTLQHRPKCPLISHLKNFPTSPNGKSALYLRAFRCVIHTRKKWNRDTTFYLLLILKTYETATFYFTQMSKPPHLFATDSLSPLKIYWAKRSPESHHEKKKHLQKLCKCLIISVDQLGLEPRTSRLWVCCSNQLSYKSDEGGGWRLCGASATILTAKVRISVGINKKTGDCLFTFSF